ncbi:late embryogenesis abundant protein [Striga asiatica]|uniref:Late embryogenesis abundant protein n=1 Tax=Striga asiatica TaxID=4170 RepID=A0A5A7R6U6_STRAF|nr:late embryogenesis abundant protein [Striga asiatica]
MHPKIPTFEIESASVSLHRDVEFNATVWKLGFTVEKQTDKMGDFGVWVRCAKYPYWWGREMGTFGGGENGTTTRANVTLITSFDCGPPKAMEYDVMFKGRYWGRAIEAVCKNMTAEPHGRFVVGRPRSCPVTESEYNELHPY